MEPVNFLDEMVARFRHRWETNPQYRAMMSGVVGLVTIVGLCSCGLIASLVANSVFVSNGLGSSGSASAAGQQQVGGGVVQGVPTFPTAAIPTWQVSGLPPASVAPTSQTVAPTATPIPSPTAAPTATCPDPTCGGGGGGGGGHAGTISGYGSPNPWITTPPSCNPVNNPGPCDHVIVQTSVPNNPVNIIIKYCNGATILNSGATVTDGAGNGDFPFVAPGGSGQATIQLFAQSGAGSTFSWPCR